MTGVAQQSFKIEISSRPENITLVEQFVDDLKESLQISDDLYGHLLICLTEAVNNSIIHGNESDPNKKVLISASKEDNRFSFVVKDEGNGFDYNSLPDPTDPANLHKLTGRGVFLMKQLSDLLIFSQGGSQVEMQFKA